MKPYRTLIVEDDATSLADLRYYLDKHPSVINVACTVETCSDAIDVLLNGSYQISILDIKLPDGNCFDIINKISRSHFGEIIFCTPHGGRFIEELVAAEPIYYLGKPFSKSKVQELISRVEQIFERKQDPIQYVTLFKNHTGTRILVNKEDILYIEYSNGSTIFHFREKGGIYSEAVDNHPLTKQLERLNNKFIQCHKNYIINVDFIKEYEPDNKEGFIFTMPNSKTIVITKNFKDEVFARKGVS